MSKQENKFYQEDCTECNGTGYVDLNNGPQYGFPKNYPCFNCRCNGKIYWTDKIKGVKNKSLPDGKYGVLRKTNGKWYYNLEKRSGNI